MKLASALHLRTNPLLLVATTALAFVFTPRWTESGSTMIRPVSAVTFGAPHYNNNNTYKNNDINDPLAQRCLEFAPTYGQEYSVVPFEPGFNNILVFGDSFSDVGNIYKASNGTKVGSAKKRETREVREKEKRERL